jgi:hypothetical protein
MNPSGACVCVRTSGSGGGGGGAIGSVTQARMGTGDGRGVELVVRLDW